MKQRIVVRHVLPVGRTSAVDIVIEDGYIRRIAEAGTVEGEDGFDGRGMYVSSGWIDMHVHAFSEFQPYGDDTDEIGVKQGVTVIVDAGSCGADRIADLAAHSGKAKTKVFAFLNISSIGLESVDELSNPEWIRRDKAAEAVRMFPDFIVGLKARMSRSVVKDSGIRPLVLARLMSDETSLPLMVHIGSAPPRVEEVLGLLEKNDIVTHYLHGKANSLFTDDGKPKPELLSAVRRGVKLDVGHGTASFSFRTAEYAKACGISFDTISTDIYRGNRLRGPVFSLASVLTKFLHLGYSLEDVIGAVTAKPAEWLGRPELGRIQEGDKANLTLFALKRGRAVLVDSEGERREADISLQPKGAIVDGEFIEC